MAYNQGDIVWLDVAFTDGSGSKPRPVIIISNSSLNSFDVVICLKMTKTFRNDGYSFQVENKMLTKSINDKNTVIRFSHVMTIDVQMFTNSRANSSLKTKYLGIILEKFQDLIALED